MTSATSYWNLRDSAFENVADTRFAYLADQHREGLARLVYIAEGHKLGGVLVGPFGVGKSMILELLGERVRKRGVARFLHLDASSAGTLALARVLLRRLGNSDSIYDITQALEVLAEVCGEESAASHLVVAVDEAHLLQDESSLEFLHLLTNLRVRRKDGSLGRSAVTLVLAGHPELLEKVAADGALRQRLQLVWSLQPLNEAQTVEYVHFRIRVAGGDIWTFEPDSLAELYRASGGIPRVVNNICDIALLLGSAANAAKVTVDVMRQAIEETSAPNLRDLTLKRETE